MIPVARDKILPRFPGSRQCYEFFINYILRLHVKSFILARQDSSIALPVSHFSGTKFSQVNRNIKTNLNKYRVENCPALPAEIWFPQVIVEWNLSRPDWMKFYPIIRGLCYHQLSFSFRNIYDDEQFIKAKNCFQNKRTEGIFLKWFY